MPQVRLRLRRARGPLWPHHARMPHAVTTKHHHRRSSPCATSARGLPTSSPLSLAKTHARQQCVHPHHFPLKISPLCRPPSVTVYTAAGNAAPAVCARLRSPPPHPQVYTLAEVAPPPVWEAHLGHAPRTRGGLTSSPSSMARWSDSPWSAAACPAFCSRSRNCGGLNSGAPHRRSTRTYTGSPSGRSSDCTSSSGWF